MDSAQAPHFRLHGARYVLVFQCSLANILAVAPQSSAAKASRFIVPSAADYIQLVLPSSIVPP